MNQRAWLKGIFALVVCGGLLGSYTNCSSIHGEGSLASSMVYDVTGVGKWTCADQLSDRTLFDQTYAKFFAQHSCSRCHDGSGRAPGAFASVGPELAFQSFSSLGFAVVNRRALTPHGDGAAGPQHTGEIQSITVDYLTGLNSIEACDTTSGNGENQDTNQRIKLRSKPIPVDPNDLDQVVQITWNLDTDVYPNANYVAADFAGVDFVVDVNIFQRPGIVSYVVSNPRIVSSNADVHVDSMLFKLNGAATPSQRAFFLTDKQIRAWNAQHPDFNKGAPGSAQNNALKFQAELLSGGALVLLGDVRTTDLLSVSMDLLEKVVLPPPDLGPIVRFQQSSLTITESSTIVDIPIQLSKQPTGPVSVVVDFGMATNVKDECCFSIVDENGADRGIRHFDRDIQDFDIDPNFKINTRQFYNLSDQLGGLTNIRGRYIVTFLPGDPVTDPTPVQNLRIRVVGDDRYENNGNPETLELVFDPNSMIGVQPDTVNQSFTLTINNDGDVAAPSLAMTFTKLMQNGGILNNACLRCHNSFLFRGGYDLTNYEQLIARGILVRNDPCPLDANGFPQCTSEMFLRMNVTQAGKSNMPLTGLLPTAQRDTVAQWIRAGAANN